MQPEPRLQTERGEFLGVAELHFAGPGIEGTNPPSERVAAKLGFVVRGPGTGRFGEPITASELRR
jgi:hypothetical protein